MLTLLPHMPFAACLKKSYPLFLNSDIIISSGNIARYPVKAKCYDLETPVHLLTPFISLLDLFVHMSVLSLNFTR